MSDSDEIPAWQVLADVLLQCEALVCRLGDGLVPRDFAGLYVGDDDVQRVLASLPGLGAPEPEQVTAVRAALAPQLTAAGSAFAEYLRGGSVFARVCRVAGLGLRDAMALALLAAVDASPQRGRLVAYVQDNVQVPRLTMATLSRILGEPVASSLGPGGALRTAALVETSADGPWAGRTFWPAARVSWALAGDGSPDPGLPAGTRRAGTTSEPGEPELLLATGADAATRFAAVAARCPGRGLLVCRCPATPGEWAAVVREAVLGDRVVVLEVDAPLDAEAAARITDADRLTWVLSSAGELPLNTLPRRAWRELRLDSALAGPADWQGVLGIGPDPAFPLTRDQLPLVAAAAGGDPGRVADGVRRLAGGHLDQLAVRVRPQRTMTDLVLPTDQSAQITELIARCRLRSTVYQEWGFSPLPSTGVVALFSGPSGTGKTLAAEVLAGELGLDLYKIDLSSVVSKYIGETEKNLERIFQAASAGELVLFFDEADALFGKRSEVSSAHDRYANVEVAYLLQRLETYQGIVVVATNLQRNIDDAFLRRISVAVDFEAPDEPHRKLIWQQAFPATAPVEDLDLDFLARQFRITGGIIRNAALGAAFLAAADDGKVTMERVVLAIKREFQKLGRLRTEAEFGPYYNLVKGDDDAAPAR